MNADPRIKLVPRGEWGAAPPEGKMGKLKLPVDNVYFTYTNTSQCSSGSGKATPSCVRVVKEIQQESMYEKGLADIPYNFLLGGDGCVYEGRGWKNKPEDVPEEPELKGKEALVVAYIGREDDMFDAEDARNMAKTSCDFMRICINEQRIIKRAITKYIHHDKYRACMKVAEKQHSLDFLLKK